MKETVTEIIFSPCLIFLLILYNASEKLCENVVLKR